jgi:hypothetical protein
VLTDGPVPPHPDFPLRVKSDLSPQAAGESHMHFRQLLH